MLLITHLLLVLCFEWVGFFPPCRGLLLTTLVITGTSLFCSFLPLNRLINSLLSMQYQLYYLRYLTILGKITFNISGIKLFLQQV